MRKCPPIRRFRGKYSFLSNFYPAKVIYGGDVYPTVEHAYQAAKTYNRKDRKHIRRCNQPAAAKALGREVDLKDGWYENKDKRVMLKLLRQKFSQGELRQQLLDTGDAFITHGNEHGDCYWGVCVNLKDGYGDMGYNHLGVFLMKVRSELQHDEEKKGKNVREKGKVKKGTGKKKAKTRRRVHL